MKLTLTAMIACAALALSQGAYANEISTSQQGLNDKQTLSVASDYKSFERAPRKKTAHGLRCIRMGKNCK